MENYAPIITDLNKKDIKLLMLYLLEGVPDKKYSISRKDIIKLNKFKLPEELAKLYEELTERKLVSVSKQTHLVYSTDKVSQCFLHKAGDPADIDRLFIRLFHKKGIRIQNKYDKLTLVYSQDNILYNETIPHKFNYVKFEGNKIANFVDKVQ